MKYIRHQECEIQINGEKFFAKDASLSTSTSIEAKRVYGGELRNYLASSAESANVQFSYYLTGKEDSIGFLTGNNSCSGSFCGINFSGAYLTNYGIEIAPYKPVQFSASFDIYSGFESETKTGSFTTDPVKFANGAYTELLNFNKNNIGLDFPTNISYSVECERKPSYVIGQQYPQDVVQGKVSRMISINGENIGKVIDYSGRDFAKVSISPKTMDYAARGRTIECEGIITSQNLSISTKGLMNGSIEVMESMR